MGLYCPSLIGCGRDCAGALLKTIHDVLDQNNTHTDIACHLPTLCTTSLLADIVSRLVNMAIGHEVVPATWRTAITTPVPKCTPVSGASDLRPISVTPILSRMVERLVVKNHISLAIPPAK